MDMNKTLIDCMQLLRRRVRNEQGLDIHLHQPDAVAALLMASRTSREPETHALGERLAGLVEQDQPSVAAALSAHHESAPPDNLRVRIYRGQRVLG
ncbi:MAG TPA: hypothetical protein VL178_06265 [Pseudomonas sp.]|jgi:hypothetical protein|nr:hypothetical protein [Pseudomonas sp.]